MLRRIKRRIKGQRPAAESRPLPAAHPEPRRPRQAPRPLSEMDRSRCLICRSPELKIYDIERRGRHFDVRICRRCHYVSNAGNTVDYTKFQSVSKFALTPGSAPRTTRAESSTWPRWVLTS